MNRFDDDDGDSGRAPLIYTIAIVLALWLAIGVASYTLWKAGGGQ